MAQATAPILDSTDRVRSRPSFRAAVDDWLSPADTERYADAPDPWPKVQDILRAA